jgi:hypothetical protein
MILKLIEKKRNGRFPVRYLAGLWLYLLNLLLVLDFAIAGIAGADPRLSVSALLGIRLARNPQHPILSRLPQGAKAHLQESASWWQNDYPPVNRSIWT